eukprot:scaffold192742_cov33-Prasinocladus_malaysianus.AAC.2
MKRKEYERKEKKRKGIKAKQGKGKERKDKERKIKERKGREEKRRDGSSKMIVYQRSKIVRIDTATKLRVRKISGPKCLREPVRTVA